MKIIIFMPSLSGGGPKRLGSDFSLYLGRRHKVTIALMEDSRTYPYEGNVVVLGKNSLKRFPIRGLRFIVNIIKFRKLVKDQNPDLVMSFQEPPSSLNIIVQHTFLKKRYRSLVGAHLAVSQGESEMNVLQRFITKALVKVLYRMADGFIACSQGVKDDLVEHYSMKPSSINVVYNPVNTERILEAAKEKVDHPWFSMDTPIITNVGRLAVQKNQIDLLKAFAKVRKERACRLVIIGEGPLLNDLIMVAKGLGIIEDVLFTGFEKNPFRYLAKSTLFAFSSVYEGFGLVIVEAMIVGCPVISTDCIAGPREILAPELQPHLKVTTVRQERYGLLVPVHDADALAQGIIKLLESKELREKYSQAGKLRARDFDIERIAGKYLDCVSYQSSQLQNNSLCVTYLCMTELYEPEACMLFRSERMDGLFFISKKLDKSLESF